MADYRYIGGRLGSYIRLNNPSVTQLKSFLADLLAGDEMLRPMLDTVSRSSFSSIRELAGSGNGCIQRDSLLQELALNYLPEIVYNISILLSGLLDLPEARDIDSQCPQSEISSQVDCRAQNPMLPDRTLSSCESSEAFSCGTYKEALPAGTSHNRVDTKRNPKASPRMIADELTYQASRPQPSKYNAAHSKRIQLVEDRLYLGLATGMTGLLISWLLLVCGELLSIPGYITQKDLSGAMLFGIIAAPFRFMNESSGIFYWLAAAIPGLAMAIYIGVKRGASATLVFVGLLCSYAFAALAFQLLGRAIFGQGYETAPWSSYISVFIFGLSPAFWLAAGLASRWHN